MNPDIIHVMTAISPDPLQVTIVGWRGDCATYRLDHRYRVSTSRGVITIPAYFETDGLSIPSAAWAIVGPDNGPAFAAGILHDYLYSRESTLFHNHPREVCDLLFKEAMFNLGIGWLRRETIYRAVRMFGGRFYKR